MKKIAGILAVAVIMMVTLLGAVIPTASVYADDPVRTFPDAALDEQAHLATGVPALNDIHQSDLDAVVTFYANGYGVEDLTGMEHWITLTSLYLTNNHITDISPLGNLSSLDRLYLESNIITNISCLVGVLGSGDLLQVSLNPLNDDCYETYIPALEADGVAVYADPDYPDPPVIPPPPYGNRSVFELPTVRFEEDEALFQFMFTFIGEVFSCEEWAEGWESSPLWVWYMTVIENNYTYYDKYRLARGMYGFNTSEIPDDAVITDAFLRISPWEWEGGSDEDYRFIVGGTHNTSVFPFIYDGYNLSSGVNYSVEEFYGNFGSFNISDLPLAEGEGNYNSTCYADIVFNNDGVSYINPTGLTALNIRAETDIDHICPDANNSVQLWLWSGPMEAYYYFPTMRLVVDWHEPIIPSGSPVSSMMVILGLVFSAMGVLGILGVLLKGENLAIPARIGLLTGFVLFFVIGVVIIQGIIVAVT